MSKTIKIKLHLTDGTHLDTANLKNKTILFFYPKALTSGCSIEVADFQKKLTTFKKLGFDIVGASKDEVNRNLKFAEKFKLNYPLGSDAGDSCDKLGIWEEKSMYGKKYYGINRSTFILGKNGTIIHSWLKVKVKGHVDEVIDYIKKNNL